MNISINGVAVDSVGEALAPNQYQHTHFRAGALAHRFGSENAIIGYLDHLHGENWDGYAIAPNGMVLQLEFDKEESVVNSTLIGWTH